ncbi:MAG: hypothetical protein M3O36_03535 [Myxococcota bacterium]|nr:hypothetical protein [Myxococcota bacterium]
MSQADAFRGGERGGDEAIAIERDAPALILHIERELIVARKVESAGGWGRRGVVIRALFEGLAAIEDDLAKTG